MFTSNLSERKVMVSAADTAHLPAVQVQEGLSVTELDWNWIMGLGKNLPVLPVYDAEAGSFRGDFKAALAALRKIVGETAIGCVYDNPVTMTNARGARITRATSPK